MGLYEKIYSVMNESAGLEKDLTVGTGASSYRAVGEKEVLNMLKPLFKKHKLIVFPVDGDMSEQNSVFESTYKEEVTTKTRNVTQIKVKFKIVDIETGESEILMGFGNGADSQDKGSGKAFTYAFKTMLSKTFMLFSGEDTDNTHSDDIGGYTPPKAGKPQDKPQQEQTATGDIISKPQANRIYALSGGNADICKEVLKTFGYAKSDEVQKKHYEAICKAVTEVAEKDNKNKDGLPY
jgi:hypothetical protein